MPPNLIMSGDIMFPPPMKGRLAWPHTGLTFIIGLNCWPRPNGGTPFCQGLSGADLRDMILQAEGGRVVPGQAPLRTGGPLRAGTKRKRGQAGDALPRVASSRRKCFAANNAGRLSLRAAKTQENVAGSELRTTKCGATEMIRLCSPSKAAFFFIFF